MNPDDLKNNPNNQNGPDNFIPGVPDFDLNDFDNQGIPELDPNMYGANSFDVNDTFSDEMNQYLSDAVSDSFDITPNKQTPDDDLNPTDPFGLGSDDSSFSLDDIPELEPSNDVLNGGITSDNQPVSDFIPPVPDEIGTTNTVADNVPVSSEQDLSSKDGFENFSIDDMQNSGYDVNSQEANNVQDVNNQGNVDYSSNNDSFNSFDDSFTDTDLNQDNMSPVVDLNSNNYQEPVDTNANYDNTQYTDNAGYQEPVVDYNNLNNDNQVVDFDSSLGEAIQELNDTQNPQDYGQDNLNNGYDVNNQYNNYDTNGQYNAGYDPNNQYNNYDANGQYNAGYDPNNQYNNYDANGQYNAGYDANNQYNSYDANGQYNAGYDPNNQYNNYNANSQYNTGYDVNSNYNNSSFNQPNFTAPAEQSTPQNLGNVGEPLKAPSSVTSPKTKVKKGGAGKKIFIFFIILILIAGIAYGGYYVYTNYIAKSQMTLKNKFFASIANSNVLDIAPDSQLMDTLTKVFDESHSSKLELSVDSDLDFVTNIATNQGIDLNKLKLIAETVVNKESDKSSLVLKANYANNDIATREEIINKDYTAIKTDGVTEKYLATIDYNARVNRIINPTSIISNYLPTNKNSMIQLRNNSETITLNDDDIKKIIDKYSKVIADQFVEDQFSQTENVKLQGVDGTVTGIKLKLTDSQVTAIYKAVLEAMLNDDNLIDLVASTEEDNTIKESSFRVTNPEVPTLNDTNIQGQLDGQTQVNEIAPVEGQTTNMQASATDIAPVSTDDNIVTGTFSNDDIVSSFTTSEPTQPLQTTAEEGTTTLQQDNASDASVVDDNDLTSTSTIEEPEEDLSMYADAGIQEILNSLLTRAKSRYTAEEIKAGLKYQISLSNKTNKSNQYDIVLYESDNKARRIEFEDLLQKITIDFTYGEKNTIKFTVLSSAFDALEDNVNSVVDNMNRAVPEMSKDMLEVDESKLPAQVNASSATNITDNQNTTQTPDTAPNSFPTFSGAPVEGNTVTNQVVNNTTTNTTTNSATDTTSTQGNSTSLNAGLTEEADIASNTATMNDERISSSILDMMPEEDTNTTGSNQVVKDLTNGFSIVIEKTGTDFTSKYGVEFDVIRNNSINHKFKLETSTNGKASSKDVKNAFKFTYNNKTKHFSITLNYNITFDISKLNIPDFTTDNAIFVDKLGDTEIDSLEKEIEVNTAKLITQVKKDLNLIDDKNTPVEVEQPVVQQPTTQENRISQEEAQNILVDAISKYMGDVMARGETFTLNKLETFTLPNHEYSCVVNGEIAIIEIDGYRFHLDSSFNLSAE